MEYILQDIDEVTYELTTDDKRVSRVLNNLIDELNITVKETWVSKYNKYVVYEYQPFCNEGFNKVSTLFFKDKSIKNYFEYLFAKIIDDVKQLELCLANSIDEV